MRRIFLFLAAFVGVAFAADFWIAKPYTEWSGKEAAKLLSNSPWARAVAVGARSVDGDSGVRPGVAGSKIPVANTPDGGVGPMDAVGALPDGTRRPGDPTQAGLGSDAAHAVVRWQSALPVKQALLVRKGHRDLTSPEDAKRVLEVPETHYVLAVSGLRMALPLGGAQRAMQEQIRISASLSIKGRDPILAERVEFAGRGNGVEIFVLFPRAQAISAEDREVEFRATTPAGAAQAKFRLKDMLVAGKLAL